MKTSGLLIVCASVFAGSVYASDTAQYPLNTTIRDYAKRDRLLIGGLDSVSPSQLHENEGMRARIEGESQNSKLTKQGVKSQLTTPSVSVGAAYGWTHLTLGVEASQLLSARNEGKGTGSAKEDFESQRIMPEIAYTFGKYFTAGVGVEFSTLKVKEDVITTHEFSYDYERAIAGLSYHEPAYEVGVAFTQEIKAQDSLSQSRESTLSLASTATPNERSIYLPAMGTAFVRGNVTDSFSLMSSVSMARYDGNVDGSINLFEEYRAADRLAAKLLGTYWTDARSRISLAAEYKGAASSAINTEENGLGYRLANLYGGTLEGVLAVNRLAYIGVNASYMRGERADTEDASGIRYTAKEKTQKFAGFVTVKL